jgi:putative phage-type endonuclease
MIRVFKIIAKTEEITKEQWLAIRRNHIGGSDAGAVCNVSPWATPIDIYMDKKGIKPAIEENQAMYWGTRLESMIADEFEQRNDCIVFPFPYMLQHETEKYMIADVDRLIFKPELYFPKKFQLNRFLKKSMKFKRQFAHDLFINDYRTGEFEVSAREYFGVLECKTGSEYMKDNWKDGQVPDHYQLQLYHYLEVTGLNWGYIAALLGGNEYKQTEVRRNDELAAQLKIMEHEFWYEYVMKDITPPASVGDKLNLQILYPQEEKGKEVQLPGLLEAYRQRQEWNEKVSEAMKQKEFYENIIKAEMKDAEKAMIGDNKVTWKYQHKDAYMVQAQDNRIMRFTNAKVVK